MISAGKLFYHVDKGLDHIIMSCDDMFLHFFFYASKYMLNMM